MKTAQRILIVIISLVGIILITGLFMKNEYVVEREIIINKSKTDVFGYVKFLKNQGNYSVWAKKDPNIKKEFRGTDGAVGFVSAWDSEIDEVGKGEQEIKKITGGERIDTEIRFQKPFEATDNAYMITIAVSEKQTKVKWGFTGKMNYPMNISLAFMNMDEKLGDDLEIGLTNLKALLEK